MFINKRNYKLNQKIENYLEYFKHYLWLKQHFNIELPAEVCGLGKKFDYVSIKLSDIRRIWKGKVLHLEQCAPYLYLATHDKNIYLDYINEHIAAGLCPKNCSWNIKQLDDLYLSIQKTGYDPTKSIICVDQNNVVLDGQHRACCLLKLLGGDASIFVIKVTTLN